MWGAPSRCTPLNEDDVLELSDNSTVLNGDETSEGTVRDVIQGVSRWDRMRVDVFTDEPH